MNYDEMSNAVLLSTLDDIAQALAKENNEEWAKTNETKKQFIAIKNEIAYRLNKTED